MSNGYLVGRRLRSSNIPRHAIQSSLFGRTVRFKNSLKLMYIHANSIVRESRLNITIPPMFDPIIHTCGQYNFY